MEKHPEIVRAQEWFERSLSELLETHGGEYIAVIDDWIVVHGPDLGIVTREVYAKYS